MYSQVVYRITIPSINHLYRYKLFCATIARLHRNMFSAIVERFYRVDAFMKIIDCHIVFSILSSKLFFGQLETASSVFFSNYYPSPDFACLNVNTCIMYISVILPCDTTFSLSLVSPGSHLGRHYIFRVKEI